MAALAVALPGPALIPQERPREGQAPAFGTTTAVVTLDLVVRDKKGRPVRDLKPGDIEVFEDDARCPVRSFRLVEGESGVEAGAPSAVPAPEAPAPAAAVADPAHVPTLVTLVFDRFDAEGAKLARKAALDFVARGSGPRTRIAVFRIASGLALLAPYSADAETLNAAIGRATDLTDLRGSSLTKEAQKRQSEYQALLGQTTAPSPTTGSVAEATSTFVGGTVAGGIPASGTPFGEVAIARVEAQALQMADSLQRQQEGEQSLYPLLALFKALERLPGRKTVLYFSMGLTVPPNLDELFRSAVSEANRANVSVYAVDARGLRGESDSAEARKALEQASATALAQSRKASSDAVTRDDIMVGESAADSLRLNQQGTLSDLAESTGGLLIANSNDLRLGMERVASDVKSYYEMTYEPVRADFDGAFRKIRVKVARKDVVVQSRSGYFALPPSDQIVLPYEFALMAALSVKEPARDFDYRAAALHFAPAPAGRTHTLLVQVPLEAVTFATDTKKKTWRLRLSVMAMVKDDQGRLVERWSDDYPLTGPLEQLEAVRQGQSMLRRQVTLGPGRYTLETAAVDRTANKVSVKRAAFEVAPVSAGPALSSVSVIRRAEPLPTDAPPSSDPFRVEGIRLVPNLDAQVQKSTNANLSLFAIVYPAAGAEAPTATLEFWRDGKAVGRAQPELSAADKEGHRHCVAVLPTAAFAPGNYEVRLRVAQGPATVEERAALVLVP
jgi:VWFA-related protein